MTMFSNATINIFLNAGGVLSQLNKVQGAFAKTADKIQNNFITKLGALALGGSGIRFLTGLYDEAVKIQNLAESWNLPVEKVSKFTQAFSLLGGSSDDALNSIEKLQQLSNQLKFDSSGALRELSARLGTNLFNKDFQGAINSLRGSFRGLSASAQKKVLDMLGTDNMPMLRMLRLSNTEYDKLNKDAEQYGYVTQQTAVSVRKMEMALYRIKTAVRGILFRNFEKAIPYLDKFSDKLEYIADLSPEVKEQILGVTTAFLGLAPALRLIGFVASTVFNPMTILIAALAGGAFLLYKNWDKVNKAVSKYMDESPNLQAFLSTTKELFEAISAILKEYMQSEAWQDMKTFFKAIEKATQYLWNQAYNFGSGLANRQNGGNGIYIPKMTDEEWEKHINYAADSAAITTNNNSKTYNKNINIGTINVTNPNPQAVPEAINSYFNKNSFVQNGASGRRGN